MKIRAAITDAELAEIIVSDTIRSAHTNPLLAKDATVQDWLDALKSKGAGQLVQAMLREYSVHDGQEIDPRTLGYSMNVTAHGLTRELTTQLEAYLEQPQDLKAWKVRLAISAFNNTFPSPDQ